MGPPDPAAGSVDAIYGAPLDGLAVTDVPPDLAPLFADAHTRLQGGKVAIHTGDGVLRDAAGRPIDPDDPADGADTWASPPAAALDALRAARTVVVLAGPGVVRDRAVAGLHAVAAAASVGVLNTWGAKGVFDWRSRHHLATVGLQAEDFVRGGLAEVDVILATGVDDREALGGWRLAPVVELAPAALDPLAEQWTRPFQPIAIPTLRDALAAVTQAGWQVDTAPLPPSLATRNYSTVLGARGLVAADPGIAGYWVARTFPTTRLGGAQVPADAGAAGFAIACATVARLLEPHRPVLAVADAFTDVHARLADTAHRLGAAVAIETWAPDGDALDATGHLDRLPGLLRAGGRVTIAPDPTQIDRMVEVAGPVVAWR